jgi:hypothetical protein
LNIRLERKTFLLSLVPIGPVVSEKKLEMWKVYRRQTHMDLWSRWIKKLMPTDPRFFWNVTVNTHFFFLALQWSELWKVIENKTQYQIWKER